MNQPKISIIVPVFNVEPYIVECIRSVMRQTYKGSIECIVVDDCGTDNSIEVAEKLIAEYEGPVEFRVLHHKENFGLSCARNTGMDAATGDYVFFLDSDDYIINDCIENLVEFSANYDIVFGNHFISDQNVGLIKIDSGELSGNQYAHKFLQGRQVPTAIWNKLFKLDYLKKYNFHFVPGIVLEDSVFTFMYTCYPTKMFFVNKNTYYYRSQREGSIVFCLKDRIKRKEAYTIVWLEMQKYCMGDSYNEIHELYLYSFGNRVFKVCMELGRGYYQEFRELHQKYPYRPLLIWLGGEQSFHWYKTRMSWSLPSLLGYFWLQAKFMKNELCEMRKGQ